MFTQQEIDAFWQIYCNAVSDAMPTLMREIGTEQATWCNQTATHDQSFSEALAYCQAAYERDPRGLTQAVLNHWMRVCAEAALADAVLTHYRVRPSCLNSSVQTRYDARNKTTTRAPSAMPHHGQAPGIQREAIQPLGSNHPPSVRQNNNVGNTATMRVNSVDKARHKPIAVNEENVPRQPVPGAVGNILPIDVGADLEIIDFRSEEIPEELDTFGAFATIMVSEEALVSPTLRSVRLGMTLPAASPSIVLAAAFADIASTKTRSLNGILREFGRFDATVPQTRVLQLLEQVAATVAERFIYSFISGGNEASMPTFFKQRDAVFKKADELVPGRDLGKRLEAKVHSALAEILRNTGVIEVTMGGKSVDVLTSYQSVPTLTVPWSLDFLRKRRWFEESSSYNEADLAIIVSNAMSMLNVDDYELRLVDRVGNAYLITRVYDPESRDGACQLYADRLMR